MSDRLRERTINWKFFLALAFFVGVGFLAVNGFLAQDALSKKDSQIQTLLNEQRRMQRSLDEGRGQVDALTGEVRGLRQELAAAGVEDPATPPAVASPRTPTTTTPATTPPTTAATTPTTQPHVVCIPGLICP